MNKTIYDFGPLVAATRVNAQPSLAPLDSCGPTERASSSTCTPLARRRGGDGHGADEIATMPQNSSDDVEEEYLMKRPRQTASNWPRFEPNKT